MAGTAAIMAKQDAPPALYRRIAWRVVPFLMLCYAVAYIDRVNIGFAKQAMADDLGFGETAYGLGAGIFFIGYFLVEVPSNMMLARFGARRWIARIMVSWALVSACSALIQGLASYCLVRFLLGVAEAGFFPGVILYLTYWFPGAWRGRIVAFFMIAIPLAGLIGGPLSGAIMAVTDGWHGIAGWRWMLALEAVPALLLGLAALRLLDGGPEQASWLDEAERAVVLADLAAERAIAADHGGGLRLLVSSPALWRLAAIYFCCIMGQYGITFWLPSLLARAGIDSPELAGLYSAAPYAAAIATMLAVGWNADRTGERRWHLIVPMTVGAGCLLLVAFVGRSPGLAILLLSIGAAGVLTATPMFWPLSTRLLGGASAPVAIAAINSIGNLAGFTSPLLVGALNDSAGSPVAGAALLAAVLLLGAGLVLRLTGAKFDR